MDGSDEFCLPGQIECGSQFCADSIHLVDCLLLSSNSNCTSKNKMEGVGSIPSFCEFLNASTRRRLCHLHNSIACRGYGQCILTRWLMDGKKDCLDGSDEDPGYVGLFNTSFDRPFLSLSATSNNLERLTTHSTSTKAIVGYTSNSFTNIHQLVWPQRGKILNPIKNTNNNVEPSQQQKLRENIFVTTPTYPFEKIFTSSSKSTELNVEDDRKFAGKSEEESKLQVEKSKNIEISEPKMTEKQTAITETSTAITKSFEGETTTTVPAINNFISITLATESTTKEIENVELLSTKSIAINVETTKSDELLTTSKSDEENEKEKSWLWLFLLLFLFCLCCLLLPLFWWCCSSKQRRSNFFTIFRRRWRNIKLKMGGKQTQSALLPTIAATTALAASTVPTKVVIPQESGISVISESVEESTRCGGFSVAEQENTLKIPTIGEVGRIASLAQAWQQQHHKPSKAFDDSEDYLIMEECEEEEIGGTDLIRRQSSITTFLDKAKTFEKKDTTTTKTTTTTTITEEKKEEVEEEKQKEEEQKPTIELQKSSTITEGTLTIVETKTEEEKEEKSNEVVDASLQLPTLLPKEKTIEEEELPRSSSATSRPGTPTIWDQFRVLGEQYSGADDQIALATERRDSLDDILIKMDTIEKQLPIIEKHEVLIEELNEEKDEERFEDEEEKEDEEEGIVKEEEEEKGGGGQAGLTEEKTGRDVKEEKEVKEEKIKLGRDIKKGFEILPKIGNRKEGKLSTKKIGEFKKQHLEKQQKLPSIPPLDIRKCTRQHPSSSTLIKTKKEIPRLDRIEKTTKEDKSKKDEKEVFVLVKGHRVFDGHERKTPNPLFSIRREDKQKEEKRILSKQKQQKIELNEKKRTELKKDVQPIIKQRRERLLKLRAQHPIIESSCDEQFVEEPIFDPDLPSTSNYHQQHFVQKHLHLPQIEEDIEQRVHSGCILSGRQPWNSNPRTETSSKLLPPLITEPITSAERSPERIESLVHSGCITNREPWDSHLKPSPLSPPNINSPVSSKRLKTTENLLKTQKSTRRQPRPRPKSVRELTDPDWEKEEFEEKNNKNNYFNQFSTSMNFKRTERATSSPDTKEENEEEFETNNDLYSKDWLMNNKRRRNM
uniref:Uncharacterized protein n=1 Tax=Meloidogyne enterolobii TaxID=390850 RepID=A0A6V7Y092_MELEN|nr:unnamed protein product [Meloidogyne enterolobii]